MQQQDDGEGGTLDHEALRRLAEEQALDRAKALYPAHLEKMREQAFRRLADQYYREYVTPSHRWRVGKRW